MYVLVFLTLELTLYMAGFLVHGEDRWMVKGLKDFFPTNFIVFSHICMAYLAVPGTEKKNTF